jgi:AraC family transcriptional regulator
MQRSLFEPADYCALKMEYLARVLAIDAFSRYLSLPSRESEARLKRRLSAHQIRRVLDYIQEHLASNITLNDLANVAGLNRTLFIQHFKASLKATPHQYLIQTRIRQARRLISSSKLPFVDIALRCGFADQAHFSRCFRKVVGVTPSAYRWQNR